MNKSIRFDMCKGLLALMGSGARPTLEPADCGSHEPHGSAVAIPGTVVLPHVSMVERHPSVDIGTLPDTRGPAAELFPRRATNFVPGKFVVVLFFVVPALAMTTVADAKSDISYGKHLLSESMAPIENLAGHLGPDRIHYAGSPMVEPVASRSEEPAFAMEAIGAVEPASLLDGLGKGDDLQGSSRSARMQPELTVAVAQTTDASGFKSRFPKAWEAIWSVTDLTTLQKEVAEDAIELAIEVAADPVFQEYFVANLQLTTGFFIEAIKREPLRVAQIATESVGVSVAKAVTISIAANLVADAVLQARIFETMDASTKAVLHGLLVGTVSVGIQTVDDFRTGGIQAAVVKGAARRIVDLVEIYFAISSSIEAQDLAFLAVVQSLESSVNLETSVSTDHARTIAEGVFQGSLALLPDIVGADDAQAVQELLELARDALRLQAEGKLDSASKLARQMRKTGRLKSNIRPWSALTNTVDYLTAVLRWDGDIGRDAPARAAEIILRTTRLSELFMDDTEQRPVAGSAQRPTKLIDNGQPAGASSISTSLATLLIVLAGISFMFGARRAGTGLLLAALVVIALPVVSVKLGLPDYVDERVVTIALYVVGFLVAMNLLRHALAFFVGYRAADTAAGSLLASAIISVFAIFRWPARAVRRILRGFRPWASDP